MDPKIKSALLFELSGYFRKAGQTKEEGIARAMEMMLLIGAEFGSKPYPAEKNRAAQALMNLLNMPERYQEPVLAALNP